MKRCASSYDGFSMRHETLIQMRLSLKNVNPLRLQIEIS